MSYSFSSNNQRWTTVSLDLKAHQHVYRHLTNIMDPISFTEPICTSGKHAKSKKEKNENEEENVTSVLT